MGRILVVDDEKNIRKMIHLTLEKAGHHVEVAEDGTDGLARFGDGRSLDLTLVDQRMPGPKGIEVIDEMKQRDPSARVMMMTAYDTIQLATEALRVGATDFLRKPFTIDVLRGAVMAALARSRQEPGAGIAPADGGAPGPVSLAEWSEMPRVRRFLNGYYYWPLNLPPLLVEMPSPGIEVRRAFHVQAPCAEAERVIVGVVPHVRAELEDRLGRECRPDDSVWDQLCEAAVMDVIWRNASMPPPFLPVYELNDDVVDEIARRSGPHSN